MKNFWFLLVVFVSVLGLTGCDKKETQPAPATNNEPIPTTPAVTPTLVPGIDTNTPGLHVELSARYPEIPSCQSQEIDYDLYIEQDGPEGFGNYSQCGLLVTICIDDICHTGYVCGTMPAFKAPENGWGKEDTSRVYKMTYGNIEAAGSFVVRNNGILGKCDPDYIDLGD